MKLIKLNVHYRSDKTGNDDDGIDWEALGVKPKNNNQDSDDINKTSFWSECFINVDHIISIEHCTVKACLDFGAKGCVLLSSEDYFFCKEGIDEVLNLIKTPTIDTDESL